MTSSKAAMAARILVYRQIYRIRRSDPHGQLPRGIAVSIDEPLHRILDQCIPGYETFCGFPVVVEEAPGKNRIRVTHEDVVRFASEDPQ